MKKTSVGLLILVVTMITNCFGLLFGQVGVNQANPQATLDIEGVPTDVNRIDGVIAPRITGTQLRNKDNLYTAAQDGTLVYVTQALTSATVSARTKNVLATGYYSFDATKGPNGQWIRLSYNPPTILAGASAATAHSGAAVTISSINGNLGTATLESRTITLTEKSLVTVVASVPVSDLLAANGNPITDGASKGYGASFFITGGGFTNYRFNRSGATYTNGGTNYTSGIFQLGATRSITLEPGTYTIDLGVYVYGFDSNVGVRATFGSSPHITIFDIISSPVLE